jgi:hypothetical protein
VSARSCARSGVWCSLVHVLVCVYAWCVRGVQLRTEELRASYDTSYERAVTWDASWAVSAGAYVHVLAL